MQIRCPNCKKTFELNDELIPDSGRLLQCGSCDHKWHFLPTDQIKINAIEEIDSNKIQKQEEKIKVKEIDEIKSAPKIEKKEETIKRKEIVQIKSAPKIENDDRKIEQEIQEDESTINKKTKNKKNYFKIFLVLIITFIAIIILIDTFQNYLTNIFPNIKNVLNNLYETLEDIRLFVKDLIN
tara:strand:- start:420 stop:965 length:546 start_codon:yes stop_codon:yes gene_type:complete